MSCFSSCVVIAESGCGTGLAPLPPAPDGSLLVPGSGGSAPPPPPSAGAIYHGETPVGAINGSNTTFTLTYVPVAGTLQVFLNGILQLGGVNYTLTGQTITFTNPPQSDDWLGVNYFR